MKNYILKYTTVLLLVLAFYQSNGQNNIDISWQKVIGGSSDDGGGQFGPVYPDGTQATSPTIIKTYDGGFIMGSYSFSNISGDKTQDSKGLSDFWVVKFDTYYNIQWTKTIGGNNNDRMFCIKQTKDNGYILGGVSSSNISGDKTENSKGGDDYWIVKLDISGNIQWDKTIGGNSSEYIKNIEQTSDGGYILGGSSTSNISGDKTENSSDLWGGNDFWIVKIDSNANVQWDKTLYGHDPDILADIKITSDSGYILGGPSQQEYIPIFHQLQDYWIIKLNKNGNIQWQKAIGGDGYDMLKCISTTNDGGFILCGRSNSNISDNKSENRHDAFGDAWIVKLNSSGEIQWDKTLGNNVSETANYITQTSDGGYIIDGFISDNSSRYWVTKIDSLGNVIWNDTIKGGNGELGNIIQISKNEYILLGTSSLGINNDKIEPSKGGFDFWLVKLFINPKYITGDIFIDNNNNCTQNINEKGLPNYSLKATRNLYAYYSTSQTNGKYFLPVQDTGIYNIELVHNSAYPYFLPSNCNSYSIHLRDSIDTTNFALKPTILCPINTVNVSSSPPFRIGQQQTYYVNYCNNGTILSPNTYITIKLDSLLDLNSASIPYTTLPNNTYRFNIGNLDYLTCGNFTFIATPRINVVQLNQTLCTEAHIYPDTICTTPNYTGSYIVASAQCLGDSVELKLENRGGNMQQIKKYIVIEDQVMRINRNYQLPRNGTIIEKMPADSGHTYRIIAEQEDALPPSYGDKFATAAIEGCRPNPALNFSTGYFTQFPNYDGEPFRAVSCNVITGSYDPNDKVASPVGYAAQHYIEKNTQIDYQINFQNTGNDTAFKVVVVDTIAPTLDINSIQLGVASHAYQFQRTDSNVVQFVFDNILLVDSFRNEPKSHGFVKFKIQQKLNNPNGTKIYNSAGIYFDYNAPIITNRTFHTVGQNFVTVQLINTIKNPKYNVKEVKVFPNPFRDKTQIIVESNELKNPVLLLMNIQGQLIKTISSTNNNTFDIYREDLTNGMYLFKIMQSDETVANGKVVVQ